MYKTKFVKARIIFVLDNYILYVKVNLKENKNKYLYIYNDINLILKTILERSILM